MSGIFDKFRKKTETKNERRYRRYLVLGSDLYALRAFHILQEKFGKDEVALLTDKKLSEEDLRLFGPSSLRGQNDLEMIRKYFPAFEIQAHDKPNLFLKEGEWKAFGGRSKGETLLDGEDHYVSNRVFYKDRDFFEKTIEQESLEQLQKLSFIRTAHKIYKQEPTDLVERAHWKVECVGGEVFESEYLIWAYSPERFMRACDTKGAFSPQFIQACEKRDSKCVLYVRLKFSEKLTEMKETLYIPLSYTHEHGHFIGEFSEAEGAQRAEFLHFIDKEQMSEDEVAKRLRHLKKNFEKIFSNFDEQKTRDFVSLTENGGCRKIDNEERSFSESDFKNLFFIGENALFSFVEQHKDLCEDSCRTTGLTRAVLATELLIRSLETAPTRG